ncbi:MAG: hypothetical protein ABI461_15540, partial [Polyangiaceae bacterium]
MNAHVSSFMRGLVLAALWLTGCSSSETLGVNGSNPSAAPPSLSVPVIDTAPERELFVVAHQDDDLLFANP